MSEQSTPGGGDPSSPTWGPYPGDKVAPGPTPQAPEIPMSKTWPWVAGGAVALVYVVPVIVAILVVVGIIGLIAHWW